MEPSAGGGGAAGAGASGPPQPALRVLLGEARFNAVRALMMRQQSVFTQQLCELHKIARVQQVIWSELLVLDPVGMAAACTAAGFAGAGPSGPISLPPPLPPAGPEAVPLGGFAGPRTATTATNPGAYEAPPTLASAAAPGAGADCSMVASAAGGRADPWDLDVRPHALANAWAVPGPAGDPGGPPHFGSTSAAVAGCREGGGSGAGLGLRPGLVNIAPPPVPPERLHERLVGDMQLMLNLPKTLRDRVLRDVPPQRLVRPMLPPPPAVRPAATAAGAAGLGGAGGGGEVVRPAASKLYTMMLGQDDGPAQSEQPSVVQQLPRRGAGGGAGERPVAIPQVGGAQIVTLA
ncbi:hypothetical protein GPECTOR_6g691 [Gonium pectorale]|uniref:Uncharacterized protein n=1 Tax=Gonium pectorale TaxID=33097 RepID=A0A150GVI6_GONPE|nr:hypothetical protein GPECTOR_6g691 [Gonium pectorale]|eukprot:KXZ53773.1 hypothetical protein GPECTOR_6g691 [Gonium pectorale]